MPLGNWDVLECIYVKLAHLPTMFGRIGDHIYINRMHWHVTVVSSEVHVVYGCKPLNVYSNAYFMIIDHTHGSCITVPLVQYLFLLACFPFLYPRKNKFERS